MVAGAASGGTGVPPVGLPWAGEPRPYGKGGQCPPYANFDEMVGSAHPTLRIMGTGRAQSWRTPLNTNRFLTENRKPSL